MTEFDKDTVTLKKGENVMDALRNVLEKKGLADRMDSDTGIFIIDNVTVKSIMHLPIEGEVAVLEVEYEYGG